jgi:hypothetical protein
MAYGALLQQLLALFVSGMLRTFPDGVTWQKLIYNSIKRQLWTFQLERSHKEILLM